MAVLDGGQGFAALAHISCRQIGSFQKRKEMKKKKKKEKQLKKRKEKIETRVFCRNLDYSYSQTSKYNFLGQCASVYVGNFGTKKRNKRFIVILIKII